MEILPPYSLTLIFKFMHHPRRVFQFFRFSDTCAPKFGLNCSDVTEWNWCKPHIIDFLVKSHHNKYFELYVNGQTLCLIS